MAKRECPFCKEKVKDDATVCKHCRSELPPSPPKKWYQTWKGLLLILFILGAFARTFEEHPAIQSAKTSVASNSASQKPQRTDDEFIVEIDNRVKEFQKKLNGYYPNDEMLKLLNDDRVKLTLAEAAYSKPDNEKQKKILARIKALLPIVEVLTRDVYAKTLERGMLDKGFNSEINAEGSSKQILTYKYALMSKALVYKLANEGDILTSAKGLGFKKLTFTDGFDSTWNYDLTKKEGQ